MAHNGADLIYREKLYINLCYFKNESHLGNDARHQPSKITKRKISLVADTAASVLKGL